jgi:tetratricopeptide (TPR) repeat protein
MLGHEGEGHFEEAKLVWNEMTDMVQADQDNWFIRHEQAKAASAAMRDQCDLETRPRAQYWYDELTNAVRRAPDDPYMRRIQGEAAANLLLAYGSAGQFDEAETLYDEIAGMVFAHADEKELLNPQAASALNLIASYVSADRYDKAQTHYDAMAELTKSHPDESELRADQAKAALNLVIAFCGPDQLEAARRWYDELADVVSAAGRKDREELCELQAYGAGMLLAENGRAGRWTEARRLYRTLRRLSRVSSQSTVQEFKAQAAAFLTTHKQMVWADRLVDWMWSVWRRTPRGARAARIPSRFGRTGGRRPRHLRRTSDTETISADPN